MGAPARRASPPVRLGRRSAAAAIAATPARPSALGTAPGRELVSWERTGRAARIAATARPRRGGRLAGRPLRRAGGRLAMGAAARRASAPVRLGRGSAAAAVVVADAQPPTAGPTPGRGLAARRGSARAELGRGRMPAADPARLSATKPRPRATDVVAAAWPPAVGSVPGRRPVVARVGTPVVVVGARWFLAAGAVRAGALVAAQAIVAAVARAATGAFDEPPVVWWRDTPVTASVCAPRRAAGATAWRAAGAWVAVAPSRRSRERAVAIAYGPAGVFFSPRSYAHTVPARAAAVARVRRPASAAHTSPAARQGGRRGDGRRRSDPARRQGAAGASDGVDVAVGPVVERHARLVQAHRRAHGERGAGVRGGPRGRRARQGVAGHSDTRRRPGQFASARPRAGRSPAVPAAKPVRAAYWSARADGPPSGSLK